MIKIAIIFISLFYMSCCQAEGVGSLLNQLSTRENNSIPNYSQPKINSLNNSKSSGVLNSELSGDYLSWKVEKGQSLNQVLYLWAKKAGWNLVWDTNNDYMVTSSALITGDFVSAVNQLFSYTGQLSPPVYISLYNKNKVIKVSSTN